jgi:hypothetical protein
MTATTTTTIQKRIAHSHLQTAARALREAEKAVPGITGNTAQALKASITDLAAQIAAETPKRPHPGVHVELKGGAP